MTYIIVASCRFYKLFLFTQCFLHVKQNLKVVAINFLSLFWPPKALWTALCINSALHQNYLMYRGYSSHGKTDAEALGTLSPSALKSVSNTHQQACGLILKP